MKKILFYLLLLCCGVSFVACKEDASDDREIQVGTDDLKEVTLNKLTTRMILLQGGNGKYIANVADSVSVSLKSDFILVTKVSLSV